MVPWLSWRSRRATAVILTVDDTVSLLVLLPADAEDHRIVRKVEAVYHPGDRIHGEEIDQEAFDLLCNGLPLAASLANVALHRLAVA